MYIFDLDEYSVSATIALKRQYWPDSNHWSISQGSVLDNDFLASFGTFDVVYSWGVLHHTGMMGPALENLLPLVTSGGKLFIAIYNDQGWISSYWKRVKKLYNQHPFWKVAIIAGHFWRFIGRIIVRALRGQLQLRRGMSFWHDYLDWLGGDP